MTKTRERWSGGFEQAPRYTGPYAAQLLGQSSELRGARGGASILEAARTAYLGAEYSGEQDRRPSPGLLKRALI
jgi:hypothetical protein